MLVLSLVAVTALKRFGAIDAPDADAHPGARAGAYRPAPDPPALTKYLAGGTAMMGVVDDMRRAGQMSAELLQRQLPAS